MNSVEFDSGAPLGFALVSVASLEASRAFYRDRIGLVASDVVTVDAFPCGGVEGKPGPARLCMCGEPGSLVGRVLLVEYAGPATPTVRQKSDRTTRGLWNLNFYVDDIQVTAQELRAAGFEFWSDPVTYYVGEAGKATEVVFEGPDRVAINLVQPEGGADTFIGRVLAEVKRHGKTPTGFTPVATTAHCVRDLAAASAFYRDILGMRVVLDEILGKPETNRFLARPPDARTHTVFLAGNHFYGKIALNEPQNFPVPERVTDAHAPHVGYLAQGFSGINLWRAEAEWPGDRPRRLELAGIPGLPDGPALEGRIPGSGALAILVGGHLE